MTATEAKPAKRPLTDRQAEILREIVRHTAAAGSPPTVRELCAAFGIASPNGIVCSLKAIATKGWIEWAANSGKSRNIVVPELRAALAAAGAAYLENLGGGV